MTKEERKIFAVVESMIVWDYMARTGEELKAIAIPILYNKGLLYKKKYKMSCTLCEYYFKWVNKKKGFYSCDNCIWPNSNNKKRSFCSDKKGLFIKWGRSKTKKEAKKSARDIFNMFKGMEV